MAQNLTDKTGGGHRRRGGLGSPLPPARCRAQGRGHTHRDLPRLTLKEERGTEEGKGSTRGVSRCKCPEEKSNRKLRTVQRGWTLRACWSWREREKGALRMERDWRFFCEAVPPPRKNQPWGEAGLQNQPEIGSASPDPEAAGVDSLLIIASTPAHVPPPAGAPSPCLGVGLPGCPTTASLQPSATPCLRLVRHRAAQDSPLPQLEQKRPLDL